VNPLWLAWRTYDMRYIPSEGLLVVEFGGPYGLEDVIVQASMADKLAGGAAPYIEALMESPRALAMALAEAAQRREVEEAAEALARLGAAEELEKAIEAAMAQASAESASTDFTPSTPPAVPAAGEFGIEESASGQLAETSSGVEGIGQPLESKLVDEPSSELTEGATSTQLPVPQMSADETPSSLEHVSEEASSVSRLVTEATGAATETSQQVEPHIEAIVRELAHRLYSLGIDVEPSVLAAYVEKYGGEAFDTVVRDVAKALAASYRVPHAAGEVEELVKKYGLEQASAALKAAKEEAARGEDVREVLRRLLNQ